MADVAIDRLFPKPTPYVENPIGWVRAKTGEHMWSKQRKIARSVVHNRSTAVHSCHDSGKSFTASRLVCWWIDVHPPGTAFAVTTAPTAHQVDAILWREIGRAHRKGGLLGRITLDSRWRLGPAYGEELVAYGRKPADYNPEAFQGIHQEYVLVVIDEANGVPKTMWDAVDTIVTNKNARILAIGNPDSPMSHFHEVCTNKNLGWNVIHIDGFGTPNFSGEPIPDTLHDLLLSPEWVEERKYRWGVGSPMWESKVRGRFPMLADDVLVQMDWWEAACERQFDPKGHDSQFGYDIARYGEDHTMGYRMQGGVLRRMWQHHKVGTTQTAQRIIHDLGLNPGVPAVVDETGIGSGVVDMLNDQGVYVVGFMSARMPSDTRFANLRSEAYWHLRELFEFGLIDVDPADEDLKTELLTIKWALNHKGQIVVETKDDYVRRMRSHSPDAADAAMMSCWTMYVNSEDLEEEHAMVETITGDIMEILW